MKLTLSDDKKFLKLSNVESAIEYEQLKIILTKKVANYRFIPAVKRGAWDGAISFIDAYDRIQSGLWLYIEQNMNKNNFNVSYEGIERLFDDEVSYEDFLEFCNKTFEKIEKKPRDYQIEAAYNIIKFRRCCSLMATNSGKTMVAYIVFAYLVHTKKINHLLMIVPNVSLVVQATNDFLEYNEQDQVKLRIQQVYSGTEKNVGCNLTIGTYQSLVKLGQEYFNKFDSVIIDETHKAQTVSITKIMNKLTHADYRIGMSGTLPTDTTAEHLTVISQTGPVVNNINNETLISEGYSTPVKISIIRMKYADAEIRKGFYEMSKSLDGNVQYSNEKKYVVENVKRFNFVTKLIASSTKNSLVLFHLIDHGKKLYNELCKIKGKDNVLYVDGNVSTDSRELSKKIMESKDNITLVASFGTFSTGISINNIHNIFLTESFKSPIVILQSIGRLLRLHKNKDIANVIDLVDDLSYETEHGFKYVNFLMKHHKERLRIYKSQNFPIQIKEVDL